MKNQILVVCHFQEKFLRRLILLVALCGSFLIYPIELRAQGTDELLNVIQEGTSKATSAPEAAREIQNSVISEISRAQVLEILGEKRFLKNKTVIENKIIKQSAKFIPFVSPGLPLQQNDFSWKMNVELKLSKGSLRKMVLDAGLMNDSDGPTSILPMIAFVDRKSGASLRWWQGEPKDDAHKFLASLKALFNEKVQTEFSKQGFHFIKPIGTTLSPLPEQYRGDRMAAADLGFVADYFGAPMIVKGDVRFRESQGAVGVALGAIKLEVVQASSGRTVAEVSRNFETEPGVYEAAIRGKMSADLPEIAKDLAVQVLEAWQRGTLNSNLVRLSIRGVLGPKQLNEFKSSLVQNIHELKSIKERAFEAGKILFEIDYSGDLATLSERFKTLKLPAFETHVSDVSETSEKIIEIDVKAN